MAEITKDSIIADILNIAPGSLPLFQAVGMNCMGCAMAKSETLAQACAAHGVDADALLEKINRLAAKG